MRTSSLSIAAALSVAVLACGADSAQAQRVSPMKTATFLRGCKSPSKMGRFVCEAYIAGAADSFAEEQVLTRNQGEDTKLPSSVCIPTSVSGSALRETVVAWLDGHPDQQDQKVGHSVFAALHANYPCKGAK